MILSVIEKMKKIKLVEFIGRIQDGGAETLVKDYALLLDRDKFDVTILCLDYVKESFNYKTLKENNVKMVVLYENNFFINKVMARLIGKKYVARKVEKAIEDIKPDVIHVHLELLEILYHARRVLDGIKLFFTCHNPPKMLIGDERPGERDACRYLIDHYGLRIIALHEKMAEEIDEMFDVDNTAVIRNGINFEKFRNISKSKEEIRKELDINDSTYVIGQIGRFAYQKNAEFTIEVFANLLKQKEDALLLLIGRGKDEKMLRQLVSDKGIDDKVRFLIARDDIPELLKAMDVFILPSRFEGLGIVLIEAQVAGLPCVVSDNIPEEAYQSKNIHVLSLNDDKDEWVKALLKPEGNIKKYGNIENYDMNKEIKRLEELYLS